MQNEDPHGSQFDPGRSLMSTRSTLKYLTGHRYMQRNAHYIVGNTEEQKTREEIFLS